MTIFWLGAAIMVLVTVSMLMRPLLWPRMEPERVEALGGPANVAIYRDQLAELERDLRNGVLDAAQFASAKEDLQRSLLEASDGDAPVQASAPAPRRASLGAAVLVAALIPAMAVPLYLQLGAGAAGLDPSAANSRAHAQGSEASVAAMVAALQARMEANPGDLEGWLLLGRSLNALEQYAEAGAAYARALTVGGDSNPDVLAAYADVLASAQGGWLGGAPMEMLERALAIDPRHGMSLWLAGIGAYQASEYRTARDYWQRLLVLVPPGSQDQQRLQEELAELEALIGD